MVHPVPIDQTVELPKNSAPLLGIGYGIGSSSLSTAKETLGIIMLMHLGFDMPNVDKFKKNHRQRSHCER
jgi:hypothetical protein